MPIAVASRRLTLHRTWQHIHDGPHRDRGGPLLVHVMETLRKYRFRPPQNAVHSIGGPGRTSITAVDRIAQPGARPAHGVRRPRDVAGLSQYARGCAWETTQTLFAFCISSTKPRQQFYIHTAVRLAQRNVPDLASLRAPHLTAGTPTTDVRHHTGQCDRHLPSIMPAAK